MAFTFKLETVDGAPADPPSFTTRRVEVAARRQDPTRRRPGAPGRRRPRD
jgi:hypothetical protein